MLKLSSRVRTATTAQERSATDPCADSYIKQAGDIFNIEHWGGGFFALTQNGQVAVRAQQPDAPLQSLMGLLPLLEQEKLTLPVLLRFPHILQQRVAHICQDFHDAMAQVNYQGAYTLAYPIKVNPQRRVLEHLLQTTPSAHSLGFEVGTKAELMIALSMAPAQSLIVCNGYKDRAFIELALLGQRMGLDIILVIERVYEIDLILQIAAELKMQAKLGVRVQLQSKFSQHAHYPTKKRKFGLNAWQIMALVKRLKRSGQLSCLHLLQIHLGSQLIDLADIRLAMTECCRFYVELAQLGASIDCLDFGGGMAVG